MKKLSSVSKTKQRKFFESFDYVVCTIEGVLWHQNREVPSCRDAISLLQKNKKVIFVTNNTTQTHQVHYNQLKSTGYNLSEEELIRPTCAIIDYLKKCNFDKEIHLIGMSALRSELEAAGFKIENFHYDDTEESIPKYVQTTLKVNKNVGAVIVDIDLNLKRSQIQQVATYLKNPEVLFLAGPMDINLVLEPGLSLIGPGVFHNILIDFTGRRPICFAKTTKEFNDFLLKKFEINEPNKILFIGDSINTYGSRKLFVLNGLALDEKDESEDYYVTKLEDIKGILENLNQD